MMRLIRRVVRLLPWIVGAIIAWTEYRERTQQGQPVSAGPSPQGKPPVAPEPPSPPAAPEPVAAPPDGGKTTATLPGDAATDGAPQPDNGDASGGLSSFEAAVLGIDADQIAAVGAEDAAGVDEPSADPRGGEPARLFATGADQTAGVAAELGGVPPGAVAGDGTATCPDDHPIKGNASSLIYHQPGMASYERTIAEYCFDSLESAETAGFRAPRR